MEKLISEFSIGLFFWQSVLFLALLFLLRKFAWKPILNAVNEREKSIEEALNSAEQAKEELKNLQSSNQALIKEARAERDTLLKEAKEAKERLIAEAKGQAQLQADALIEKARIGIQTEKAAAMAEMKNQVASLSVVIAEKILKAELSTEDKQKTLVNSMLEEINLN